MPQRLTPIVVPVCLAGLVSVLFAGYSFATEAHTDVHVLGRGRAARRLDAR